MIAWLIDLLNAHPSQEERDSEDSKEQTGRDETTDQQQGADSAHPEVEKGDAQGEPLQRGGQVSRRCEGAEGCRLGDM